MLNQRRLTFAAGEIKTDISSQTREMAPLHSIGSLAWTRDSPKSSNSPFAPQSMMLCLDITVPSSHTDRPVPANRTQ